MNVRFGNLTTLQFENKTEIDLTPEDRLWMEEHRNDIANNLDPNKFHIFDLPFTIIAGEGCGPELVKRLTGGGYQFKRHFTVETVEPDLEPDL